jgi:glutamine amidotransferase-like uncharacterized protein
MKNNTKTTAIILFILAISIFASCKKNSNENYILIYNGDVADKDGVEKVAQMAEKKGFEVEYISKLKKLPKMLDGAKAFIIGGTEDDTGDLLEDLYEVEDHLKDYVKNGGNYLGICGGAYVASKGSNWDDGYETGMSLVNIESFAYDSKYSDPQIITINWEETQRTIYYQYGPAFSKSDIPLDSEILAYYNNEAQDVAAFVTTLGSGKIVLCGPHPEADSSWLIDDPEPLNSETWTNTEDIFEQIFEIISKN